MLKRLLLTTLLASSLTFVGQTAEARGKGHGSDAAAAPKQEQAAKPPQPGMVWVNTRSGVYHREGTQHAGRTKEGSWMTEAEAKAKGYKAVGTPNSKAQKPAAAPSGKPEGKGK